MTKGEAKAFNNNAVIFPMKTEQLNEEKKSYDEPTEQNVVETESNRINLKERFARLKKSLRKRSASIL